MKHFYICLVTIFSISYIAAIYFGIFYKKDWFYYPEKSTFSFFNGNLFIKKYFGISSLPYIYTVIVMLVFIFLLIAWSDYLNL